jgi:hypothetical protein
MTIKIVYDSIMQWMYCIEPLGWYIWSTRLAGQVASPRDKKDYLGITITLN